VRQFWIWWIAVFGCTACLAGWSMAAGNPTAINGVIGAGGLTLVGIVLGILDD
jgi:hypothetical protein